MRTVLLIISALTCLFLFISSPVLAADASSNDVCQGIGVLNPTDGGGCTDNSKGVSGIVSVVLNILSIVVAVAAIVMIIVGGLRYIVSGGNDNSVSGAKNTIIYALVGLVIVAVAQSIVHFVLSQTTKH